ncbi:MAG: pyridoxal-phosphate dependent enzyme [Bacteroidota bacterium]
MSSYSFNQLPFSPVQELQHPLSQAKGVQLLVKRDDLIHPQVSGNKWRKLKYNLLKAYQQKKNTLLTFGGPFSNHIYATAAAGNVFDFKTIGLIRGESIRPLNPTLSFAEKMGMELHFISRATYREKTSAVFIKKLRRQFGDFYLLPEGGTNELALRGCAEIVSETTDQLGETPNYWCAACGTGGTLAGVIQGLQNRGNALGFSVLKGDFHQKDIRHLLAPHHFDNWQINTDYHFGGYAKFQPDLIEFINTFKKDHNIQLEPIYTGKLFFGLYDLIKDNYFPRGSSILAVHSGGLQGIEGFNRRFGDLIG